MANKISVIIDATTDRAVASLKNFRKSIADADGAANKLKAGFAGAMGAAKANAANAAVVVGTAMVAFGVKAVGAFTETALAAGKFSDATGIAVDDASRWIEVGSDYAIGADAIEGALRKMNVALANGKPAFAEYGVEVVKTADGLTDSNATFQNALTTIGAIEDPTMRAKAAQEVFGKSYGEVARLMEMSAGDLQAALAGVSDEQVITQGELGQARQFQAAMDKLGDAAGRFTLQIGGALTPAVTALADGLGEVSDALDKIGGGEAVFTALYEGSGLRTLVEGVNTLLDTLGIHHDISVEFEGDLKAAQAAQIGTAAAADALAESTANTTSVITRLSDALDNEQAFTDVIGTLGELAGGLDESGASANSAKRAVLNYAEQLGDIDPLKVTEILALIDQGQYRAAANALAVLTAPRTTSVQIVASMVWARGNNGPGGTGGVGPAPIQDAARQGEALAKQIEAAFKAGTAKGSSGGGGGGGGGDTPRTAAEVMADWDTIIARMYEMGEWDVAQYRAHLQQRLGAYAKYSDDYMRVWNELQALDKQAADAAQAAADAASKAEKERLDAEKAAAEDAKRAAEEAQRAQDDALNRAAMQSIVAANIGGATYATINTAADPNAVINAIQQYERRNGAGWRA